MLICTSNNSRLESGFCLASWLLLVAGAACGGAVPLDPAGNEDLRADALVVTGKVTYQRDDHPWAVSSGELVPVRKTITTGDDGYGHFKVAGGSTFDIFANSQVLFRANAGNAGDLLDIHSGRVRVHLAATGGEQQQRIFTPSAVISAHGSASLSLAIDEEGAVRIDVTEGEIRVQHALLPRSEPVVVRAIDAIVVRPNESVSRQVDRGTLYRYRVKIWSALTFGHSGHDGEPVEGNKFSTSTFLLGHREWAGLIVQNNARYNEAGCGALSTWEPSRFVLLHYLNRRPR